MKSNEELSTEKETLKEKHGKVFECRVATNDDETEFCTIFLKPLTEITYKATMRVIETDELAATKILINDLYVGGDTKETITGDFDNLLAASKVLGQMYRTRKASVEKLVKKK